MKNVEQKGFTLLELLIVIAILAVLAAVTVVVLNPAELLRQARDANRVASLSSLEKAIGKFLVDGRGAPRGSPNVVHISLPDPTAPACGSHTLPALPSGWAYHCSSPANFRNINGTGWIPIDFTILPGGAPLAVLPIDPVNNTTHFLAYVTGASYAITAMPESSRFLQRNANRDGGTDPARIEAGTSRALWARANGLVGYWPFENNFQDASGLANHGTQTGDVGFVPGRQGQAGNFDGVNDFVSVPHTEIQNTVFGVSTVFTLASWVHPRAWANHTTIMNKATDAWYSNTTNGMWADLAHGFLCVMGSNVSGNPAGSNIVVVHRPPLNQWHHIVCTANGTHLIMLVNGIEVGRVAITGLTHTRSANTAPLVFGRRCVGCTPSLDGFLDEVRIYNRALTADEVRAIFEATR